MRWLVLAATSVVASSVGRAQSVSDTLFLTFDDPLAPFFDASPHHHAVASHVLLDDPDFPGAGVQWSNAAPSPAGGGYAVFDGGSYLEIPASPVFEYAGDEDLTLRFWFRSPGIDRGADFGHYRNRQHAMGFGKSPDGVTDTDNLDIDFDDPDVWYQPDLWVYWSGQGSNQLITPNPRRPLTDDAWHQLYLVREDGAIRVVVRDALGNIEYDIGPVASAGTLGSAIGKNFIGRGARTSSALSDLAGMLWLGAIDDVRLTKGVAIAPEDEPVDVPACLSAQQSCEPTAFYITVRRGDGALGQIRCTWDGAALSCDATIRPISEATSCE